MKLTQLTIDDAKKFYAVHSERPFYGDLVEFMSRGPIVAAVLEKRKCSGGFPKIDRFYKSSRGRGRNNPKIICEKYRRECGTWVGF